MSTDEEVERQRLRRVKLVTSRTQSLGCIGPFLIEIRGRQRLFEFHGVCGPSLVNQDGELLDRQPAASSPFWGAFDAWVKAGCHVDRFNRAYVPSERIMKGTPA